LTTYKSGPILEYLYVLVVIGIGANNAMYMCYVIYIYKSQNPLTPGVSQKTYTKFQPFNLINSMVLNMKTYVSVILQKQNTQ